MKCFRSAIVFFAIVSVLILAGGCKSKKVSEDRNLAVVAKASFSGRQGISLSALNDGIVLSQDSRPGFRPPLVTLRPGTQWVQYEWVKPVAVREVAIFWWADRNRIKLPKGCTVKYLKGEDYFPVVNQEGPVIKEREFNRITFDEVKTTGLRLEIETDSASAAGILEWVVYAAPSSPVMPPVVDAGHDRTVILAGNTYLSAVVRSVDSVRKSSWKKLSGPGNVIFANASQRNTTATFDKTGDYVIAYTAVTKGNNKSSSSIMVKVIDPPDRKKLEAIYTEPYSVNNPLWSARIKAIIVNWIPHCIRQIERTDLTTGQGGLDNFIEAAKALKGMPHGRHLGYVFSNAWVHQTVESMAYALMIDPQGDREIIAAQNNMKKTLEKWIPIILAAQEPDGYLHTAWTLRDTTRWKNRWAPETRPNHEGYVQGYFLEAAIAHYLSTEGKDRRLFDAAMKLADCWADNIGPGKKEWWDEHEEMEQALIKFGRFVNKVEEPGKGDKYIELSKFLMDCRKGGNEYSQSHVPVTEQYEAVGHAVRAVYLYSAMADMAAEKNNIDYHSATMSLWDNIVNRKYYITGGIGSGETSEGFGPDFSLRNNSYCESCSSCGLIFFQHKMNLAWRDAKFADLYEETIYNALLGALDLEGKNFTYTNELNSSHSRYDWHVCPCCVGNIPRTLLMMPSWTYAKDDNSLFVNMFFGSTIKVKDVAETDVIMIQETDYPWSGKVKIIINPEKPANFSLFIRIPDRKTSEIYFPVPEVKGYKSVSLNGEMITPEIERGYIGINREWKSGDFVEIELPMEVQKVTADERVEADRGRVAIKYGPLVYNVEEVDQENIHQPIGKDPLTAEWRGDLLGGVIVVKGKWADGSPLIAIQNFARNNRNPEFVSEHREGSIVWIKTE